MGFDPELYQHKQWLGLVQPVGLVVSPPALAKSGAYVNRQRSIELQQRFKSQIEFGDFASFAIGFLEWLSEDLYLDPKIEFYLPEYGELLTPSYTIKDPDTGLYILLVQELPYGQDIDATDPKGWKVSFHQKFERLIRESQIDTGLIFNGLELRLIYAPRGESAGYIVFPIDVMQHIDGRPVAGALDMLLGADRLFNVPVDRRLSKILSDSRAFQALVSTKLASQVLDALWELLRGFQHANDISRGRLLADIKPEVIYGGLVTTLMRMVFLLYSEDSSLMPDQAIYQQNYSVSGLYEKLKEDDSKHHETMDARYGGWGHLLGLFRLVYQGIDQFLPARHGQLFDPGEYPFLEGWDETPFVPDSSIYRILENLLILDTERLSYKSLDVEEIGSVYEALMGYEIEQAQGLSIALRPEDIVINIEQILSSKPNERAKLIQEQALCKLSPKESNGVKEATTIEQLLSAISKKISSRTNNLLSKGDFYLQPGQQRRRSGSHYTPRELTRPLVANTLTPIISQLGAHPIPEAILSLKVCDIAVGSGAFLVETCRFLAEQLVKSWEHHNQLPEVEDPLLLARRLVAQRCLYGVDKNPFAVNLAKLSLWLITLSKDQPFTFVDHAIKAGDSLVGLMQSQITAFTWIAQDDLSVMFELELNQAIDKRVSIYQLDEQDYDLKVQLNEQAESISSNNKSKGNLIVGSFFAAKAKKEREEILNKVRLDSSNSSPLTFTPFHWENEFPEVFVRAEKGFDAIVGNPPFVGGKKISTNYGDEYLAWLKEIYPETGGLTDLVAYFFRRAFDLLRKDGTLGLIASNTIAQGDTRSSGLRFICNHGGEIYHATKRYKWPNMAAVVVSIINIFKGKYIGKKTLDDKEIDFISAYLFHAGGHEDPKTLKANEGKSFQGNIVLGMGFTFDNNKADATPIEQMHKLIEKDPKNQECIFPYIGGEEVNTSPTHGHHRYVINFGDMSEDEARKYPDLMAIVEEKVKPGRIALPPKNPINRSFAEKWWLFGVLKKELMQAIVSLERVMVIARVSTYGLFTFLPNTMVFSEQLVIFPLDKYYSFAVLQSRIHEIWASFFGSSMKDDLRYSPSDCFVTFPFPLSLNPSPTGGRGTLNDLLEEVGKEYYEFRAQLMVKTGLGLTQTYNRFHNPGDNSPEIVKLRQLHQQMDEAVLEAYGWSDIKPECGFVLEYCDLETEELPEQIRGRVESGDLFFKSSKEAQEFVYWIDIGKRKGLPWRYKWPQTTHDEVLARLLELNRVRAEME